MSKERILIVEDEQAMRLVLRDALERQGYRVLSASDGANGLDTALREKPDLILLDVMMPKLDGFSVCKELRSLGIKIPVLMLTARGQIEDRVQGLDLGADDFLPKPFSRDELFARIRALLRRVERQSQALNVVHIEDVKLDFLEFSAVRAGKPLPMTPKEFEVLKLMLENLGKVVTRQKFLDVVWGYTAFPTTRTVDKHIAALRQKLEQNPNKPRWIHTVHGVGYYFKCPDDVKIAGIQS